VLFLKTSLVMLLNTRKLGLRITFSYLIKSKDHSKKPVFLYGILQMLHPLTESKNKKL